MSDLGAAPTVVPCPESLCLADGQCAAHRESADVNVLCGACVAGYSEWGGACVRCASTNGGLVLFVLLLNFALLTGLFRLSQRRASSAALKIGLFFVSSARLMLGPADAWLGWIGLLDLQGGSGSFGLCLADLDAYQQMGLGLVAPLVFWTQLAVLAAAHAAAAPAARLARRIHRRLRVACGWSGGEGGGGVAGDPRTSPWAFELDRYLRAGVALLLMSYTAVCDLVFRYTDCVHAAGRHVVFSAPAVDCDDARYRAWLGVIGLLAALVAALPLAAAAALAWGWRTGRMTRDDATAFDRRLGALYLSYAPARSWYELVGLLRRFLLVTVGFALRANTQARAKGYVVLALGYLLVHWVLTPFVHAGDNVSETAMLAALALLAALLTRGSGVALSQSEQVLVSMVVVGALVAYVVARILMHPAARPALARCGQSCGCAGCDPSCAASSPTPPQGGAESYRRDASESYLTSSRTSRDTGGPPNLTSDCSSASSAGPPTPVAHAAHCVELPAARAIV